MGVKGSWSRVKDQVRYGANLDEILANEKKRRREIQAERLRHALEVTGGRVKPGK